MKITTKQLRKIIQEELKLVKEGAAGRQLSEFVGKYEPGVIRLFHFHGGKFAKEDSFMIDPQHFVKNFQSYSRRDWETSMYPRSFYYTDPEDIESSLMSGKQLFYVDVPASGIYDFKNDSSLNQYLKKHRHKIYGLRKGVEWEDVFNELGSNHDGIFYTLGENGPPVVAYFKPLEAKRMDSQ